ncbi:MAG TPA: MBL fold metallo-hydrolase [Burkholderiales bacterium]|nr:MBL fold metallo-hydrolase [Burkholderiales bacterium]
MRRALCAALVAGCSIFAGGAVGSGSDFRVTLLGTASPSPRPDRMGPSTLIEAGSQKLLIDAGRGVPVRLWQLRVPMGQINALFITHYHSDHTSGIPDVWLTGWLSPPFGQRKAPFHVIGPAGAKDLMSNLQRAYAADVKIRLEDEKNPAEGIAVQVDEFAADGVVYEKDGVRVTAFEVDHGDVIKPAYGYRVDFDGRSAVISGDTRYNPNVIKYGAGADLLIHEVGAARPELMKIPAVQRIIAHHTTPRDAGRVFEQTKPKLAVYTHIVRLSNATIPEPSLADLLAETRETYSGPLVFGEDLMTFDISERGVAVYRGGP